MRMTSKNEANDMTNETFRVGLPTRVYLDLAYQLRKSGDLRTPDEVVGLAIKGWLAVQTGARSGRGYQWKQLFLPDGTDLRMRYRGVWYYATVEGDLLVYAGEPVSPREWALLVSGTVRNPWRDIWLRRGITEPWTCAAIWRTPASDRPVDPRADRRRYCRRSTD
jgi:hypothetical protein